MTKSNRDTKLAVDLSKLEKMIQETLPSEIERLAPPNFPELLFDFQHEYSKLRDFILYEPLIGKKIVALGGGFSSGKSTFINTLLNAKLLPAKIDPSTSVPTYIVSSEKESLQGINVFDAKVNLEVADLKHIAHGFGEEVDDEEVVVAEEITLGHIMKSLFLQAPTQTYKSIAFLDTPGYSKPDTAGYSVKTDEKIARAQLNTADFILWFVPADGGTVTEQDIAFIKSLQQEIPLGIILNKADKKTDEDLVEIKDKIKKLLDVKGVRYTDVFTFSRSKKTDYEKAEIKALLQSWNEQVNEETFAYNFKKLFVACKEYYEGQINEENRRLNRLNKALTLATEDISEYLHSLIAELKHRLQTLRTIEGKLKQLQDDFFTELKRVADQCGIAMPEPSEIDLLQHKISNPFKLIQAYKEQQQIKTNYDALSIITTTLTGIEPKFYEQIGQGRYHQRLATVIEEQLVLQPEEIKFNDFLQSSNRLVTTIDNMLGRTGTKKR